MYKRQDISNQEKINCIDNTSFYKTANLLFKNEYKVSEPLLSEKLNPHTFKKRNVPDAASGFIHQYFTPIHHMVHNSEDFRSCMNNLYDENVKYLPNRLRITSKTKYDKNSLHIEGINIFSNNNGNISIIPVSYTHLRAHETDSYLVCRLLLEKKSFFNDTATTEIYT